MSEFIFNISSIVGVFAILDALVKEDFKKTISSYVFGGPDIDLKTFESSTIKALLSLVLINEKLSVTKTLIYSVGFIVCLFSYIALSNYVKGVESTAEFTWQTPIAIILMGAILFPLDFLSFKITKSIFLDRELGLVGTVIAIFLDAALSMIAAGVILYISYQIFFQFLFLGALTGITALGVAPFLLLFGGIVSIFSAAFINIVQILVLIAGVLSRAAMRLTKLNLYVLKFSDAQKAPFTFLGLLIGAVMNLPDLF